MDILTHDDIRRRETALTLIAATPPPGNGLTPVLRDRMWEIIERVVVPQLTQALVMALRIKYGCGHHEMVTEPLRVRQWPGGPQDIQTLTVLQFMLDRIVDVHPLRDYFTDNVDRTDSDRLRTAFTREIERIDPRYRILVCPRYIERGAEGGRVNATLQHALLTLELKPDNPNSGPSPYRNL